MKRFFLPLLIISLSACGSDDNKTSTPTVIDSQHETSCEATGNVLATKSVRVVDGDTIEVIPTKGKSERVRLLGIDAPEARQVYGTESTQSLQDCVDDAIVSIEWTERDGYGRLLGKVIANGKDCNLNQVDQGAAWHYKRYQSNQTEYDRIRYSNAEVVARSENKGLWSNSTAIAPWDYRSKNIGNTYKFNNTIYDSTNATCSTDGILTDNIITSPGTKPPTANPITLPPVTNICASMTKKTCGQMSSCTEARQQLQCGNSRIDGDSDGTPCESICL